MIWFKVVFFLTFHLTPMSMQTKLESVPRLPTLPVGTRGVTKMMKRWTYSPVNRKTNTRVPGKQVMCTLNFLLTSGFVLGLFWIWELVCCDNLISLEVHHNWMVLVGVKLSSRTLVLSIWGSDSNANNWDGCRHFWAFLQWVLFRKLLRWMFLVSSGCLEKRSFSVFIIDNCCPDSWTIRSI